MLEYTGIRVRDLERSRQFYCDGLGLRSTGTGRMAAGGVWEELKDPESGQVLELNYYPDSSLTGIALAVNTSASDFTFVAGTGTTTPAVWTKVNAPATCTVSYTAAAANAVPTIAVAVLAGC